MVVVPITGDGLCCEYDRIRKVYIVTVILNQSEVCFMIVTKSE